MRILITGGTGFIGKAVMKQMTSSELGHSILVLSRDEQKEGFNNKDIEWFTCNLIDPQTYSEKVKAFSPDVILHMAWQGIPDFSFEQCFQNLNTSLSFFKTVFETVNCKKIIVSGSCFEYNRSFGECKESDVCKSKDYFTWSKNTLRDYLEFECLKKGVVFCWARLFYVYGPLQRMGSLVPTLIMNLQSNTIPDLRTPKNSNDFIHVNDVAKGLHKLIELDIPSGVYNFGSGKSTPVIEVCRLVERDLYKKDDLTVMLDQRTSDTKKSIDFWADMEKTKQLLDWMPAISLADGISQTIHFIEN